MFGSKYRATLRYKTHNSFIISRKDDLRVVIYRLFNDINQQYNVEIIKYKVNESTTFPKGINDVVDNILTYEVFIESKNKDDLEEVVDNLDNMYLICLV